MTRGAVLAGVALLVLGVPAVVHAQAAQITPLGNHEADEALMEKISAVVEPGDVLETPAVVFASVKPGADADGLCVMAAKFAAADATAMVTGRLMCLLLDPEHLSAENALTVRLVVPEGGDRRQVEVAFDTVANEGGEGLEIVREPNTETTQGVMPVPRVPQPIADAMVTVGALKVGTVTSPRGLHVVLGRGGAEGMAAAFSVPTRRQLADYGVEWGEHCALP